MKKENFFMLLLLHNINTPSCYAMNNPIGHNFNRSHDSNSSFSIVSDTILQTGSNDQKNINITIKTNPNSVTLNHNINHNTIPHSIAPKNFFNTLFPKSPTEKIMSDLQLLTQPYHTKNLAFPTGDSHQVSRPTVESMLRSGHSVDDSSQNKSVQDDADSLSSDSLETSILLYGSIGTGKSEYVPLSNVHQQTQTENLEFQNKEIKTNTVMIATTPDMLESKKIQTSTPLAQEIAIQTDVPINQKETSIQTDAPLAQEIAIQTDLIDGKKAQTQTEVLTKDVSTLAFSSPILTTTKHHSTQTKPTINNIQNQNTLNNRILNEMPHRSGGSSNSDPTDQMILHFLDQNRDVFFASHSSVRHNSAEKIIEKMIVEKPISKEFSASIYIPPIYTNVVHNVEQSAAPAATTVFMPIVSIPTSTSVSRPPSTPTTAFENTETKKHSNPSVLDNLSLHSVKKLDDFPIHKNTLNKKQITELFIQFFTPIQKMIYRTHRFFKTKLIAFKKLKKMEMNMKKNIKKSHTVVKKLRTIDQKWIDFKKNIEKNLNRFFVPIHKMISSMHNFFNSKQEIFAANENLIDIHSKPLRYRNIITAYNNVLDIDNGARTINRWFYPSGNKFFNNKFPTLGGARSFRMTPSYMQYADYTDKPVAKKFRSSLDNRDFFTTV